MITKNDLFEQVAGQFMCDELPDEWYSLPEDELYDFIDENKWELVEHWHTPFLVEQIYSNANSLRIFLEHNGIQVHV